ncbi:hypothetical protein, partial [Escherichia coli]|uniref:hypothetical protein n=1 Tax=Escherichia coli TaxID=562 RepID=UPI00196365CA
GTADRNRSHWSTSKTPSYTKSVSWQHHPTVNLYSDYVISTFEINCEDKREAIFIIYGFS